MYYILERSTTCTIYCTCKYNQARKQMCSLRVQKSRIWILAENWIDTLCIQISRKASRCLSSAYREHTLWLTLPTPSRNGRCYNEFMRRLRRMWWFRCPCRMSGIPWSTSSSVIVIQALLKQPLLHTAQNYTLTSRGSSRYPTHEHSKSSHPRSQHKYVEAAVSNTVAVITYLDG